MSYVKTFNRGKACGKTDVEDRRVLMPLKIRYGRSFLRQRLQLTSARRNSLQRRH